MSSVAPLDNDNYRTTISVYVVLPLQQVPSYIRVICPIIQGICPIVMWTSLIILGSCLIIINILGQLPNYIGRVAYRKFLIYYISYITLKTIICGEFILLFIVLYNSTSTTSDNHLIFNYLIIFYLNSYDRTI